MTFPVRFLACNLFISLLLACLLLLKKGLKKHITLTMQYQLWYVFVLVLLLPFLPYQIAAPKKLNLLIQQFFPRSFDVSSMSAGNVPKTAAADGPFQDLSMAVASSGSLLNRVLFGIWIFGILVASVFFLYSATKIFLLRKRAYLITWQTEPDLFQLFSSCLKELGIQRKIRLYASCSLFTPVSYGWLKPTVMIPQDLDILLSEEDIRFIFLHELQHYKHKDALLNDLICFLQIIYWFNPFIWYAFGQLRSDREIACDHSVLHVIGSNQALNYGYTILRYAGQMQKGMSLSPISTMGGRKETIRQRITEIAEYQKESVPQKVKSIGILILTLLLVFCSSPLLTANAALSSPSLIDDGNWETIELSPYFQDMEGSFVLYDMTEGRYQIYNEKLSRQRVSPDSTFKIYSALFALEEQVISPNASLQKWDGKKQPFEKWEQDQTLPTAMHDSVNWYFQNLDHQVGLSKLYSYYQRISYGNCDLSGGTASYWAESSLKISPLEQVSLLSNLLENEWSCKEQNIEAVKTSLYLGETSLGKLYGKTGTGMENNQHVNGWFVGFLERDGRTYCFATHLQNSDEADGSHAAEITTQILEHIL